MDRLGIERLLLSQGYSAELHPTPAQFREENDRVMRAVRAFPDRAFGSVYISPAYLDFSLQEFDRCVRDGPMVAIGEIEIDRRANVPEMDPIAERAIALRVPILEHEWLKAGGNEPGESTPHDVVELARRHPRLQIVCAHTGGDWERGIRRIRSHLRVGGNGGARVGCGKSDLWQRCRRPEFCLAACQSYGRGNSGIRERTHPGGKLAPAPDADSPSERL